MPDVVTMIDVGFSMRYEGLPRTRERVLVWGIVTSEDIADGIVAASDIDGLWEKDYVTGWHHKRTAEFWSARAETEEALVQQNKDAEITLAAALLSLEGDLPPQMDGRPMAIAPNGVPYTIVASEDRQEGQAFKGFPTSAAAIAAWKRAMLEYAVTHPGDVLWWRHHPEIDSHVRFGETTPCWIVYSRLTIGNEADTTLARIASGKLRPTTEMIRDNIVTAEQIGELGWVVDDVWGGMALRNFAAEKVPSDVRQAFATAIEMLPPVVSVLPNDTMCDFFLETSWVAKTLLEAITGWRVEITRQLREIDADLEWLWWRVAPEADTVWDFLGDGSCWMMRSHCAVKTTDKVSTP